MDSNGSQWILIEQKGLNYIQMIPNLLHWIPIDLYGSHWIKLDLNGSQWIKLDPDVSQKVPMILNGS